MTTRQPDHETEWVALRLTPKQLCLVAALVHHQEQLLQAKGKESGRTLLSEHVSALESEHDRETLTRATQAALSRVETAITLEYYRVTFVALNKTDDSLARFQEALKETFPTCGRYVCTLWDYNNPPEGKRNDLGFHVYVPVTAEPPNVALLLELVSELKGIQFDGLSHCWLGEQAAAIDDSWTLLT